MDTKILKTVGGAIDALDFTADNATIANIVAELVRMEAAIGQAESRCSEISSTLSGWRGPDARSVADGLLAGVGAMQAAKAGPNAEDLKAEREALRSGIGDLRRRMEDERAKIETIRERAIGRAAKLSQPLVDAILADAREAAGRIVVAHAALAALNLTMRTGTDAHFRTRRAVERLAGLDNLLPGANRIDVPAEIRDLLARFENKGAALPVRAMTSVAMP